MKSRIISMDGHESKTVCPKPLKNWAKVIKANIIQKWIKHKFKKWQQTV